MISLNKKYQTRCGKPVELLSLTGKDPYPVVGYLDGELAEWTIDGHFLINNVKSTSDLEEISDIKIDIAIDCSEKSSWVRSIEVHGPTLTAVTEHGTYTYYIDQLETAQLLMTDSYGQYINMLKRR
jgi:hypothetical protein